MNQANEQLWIGLDIGSVTVKAAVVDPSSKELLFSCYTRHKANQPQVAHDLLEEIHQAFPNANFKVAVCGSGGKRIGEIIEAHFVQEVVANTIAIRHSHGTAKVAIELGGQDAKVIFFYHDNEGKIITSDMRMNGSCAGGTGAFIDQISALLQLKVEDFDSVARNGTTTFEISGRCGVFAKTDIQPLLNQGIPKKDIALSAFHALAKQTIGGLAQGMEINPPIIFEGGPFHFNPSLIRVFQDKLGLSDSDIIIPEKPEIIVAYGTALSNGVMFSDRQCKYRGQESFSRLLDKSYFKRDQEHIGVKQFFANSDERQQFVERHALAADITQTFIPGSVLDVYMGIDAGSTTTKFVLLDEQDQLIYTDYMSNEGEPLIVFQRALIRLREYFDDLDVELNIKAVGTTGYGELLFAKAFSADFHTVETVSHAHAALAYEPDVSFILDVGGQDMKAISINDGIITSITLNEACSAGCGSFIETFAKSLQIAVDDIADYAFNAEDISQLGSRCTIFMGSSIISEQKNGRTQEDILAGLCTSVIENIFTKVVRISNIDALGEKIVVQGGTFKNLAVLRAFELYAGKDIIRAPYPGEMGAIGIALLTKKHVQTSADFTTSSFIGLEDLEQFGYENHPGNICGFCSNSCNRNLIEFNNGTSFITGNKCEKGEVLGDLKDQETRAKIKSINTAIKKVPNLIKDRETLLFKNWNPAVVAPEKDFTIGLPRTLEFWNSMPFWKAFFTALGYKVKVSRKSSAALFESGLQSIPSDTVCFPAKIVHGHVMDLIEQQVDAIFMPGMMKLPNPAHPESIYSCVIIQGYQTVIRESIQPEEAYGIPLHSPMFHWYDYKKRDKQIERYFGETFSHASSHVKQAIIEGDTAINKFRNELRKRGSQVLENMNGEEDFAVIIAGRAYHNDAFINHNIAKFFTMLNVPVLTNDSLPDLMKEDLAFVRPETTINFHSEMYCSAIHAAKHPNLELVQIVSFGCGHDAIISDELERLMGTISGKNPLILKLDESDVVGPLNLRVKSFVETIRAKRKRQAKANKQFEPVELKDPFPARFTKQDRKQQKEILIPLLSRSFNAVMTAGFTSLGYKIVQVPIATPEAISLGKKFVHNDICYPAEVVVGELLSALKSGKHDPDNVAVGMFKSCEDCRLVNYSALTRKALDEAGFENVSIVTTAEHDDRGLHPGFKLTTKFRKTVLWGLTIVGALENMAYKTRPYELNKGDTEAVLSKYIDRLAAQLIDDYKSAIGVLEEAVQAFNQIPVDRTTRKPRVFIVGELLLNYHPVSNMHLEDYLEANGMELLLPRFIETLRRHNFKRIQEINQFGMRFSIFDRLIASYTKAQYEQASHEVRTAEKKFRFYEHRADLYDRYADSEPIIDSTLTAGEGWILPEEIMAYAEEGYKSFVVVGPFGCLPNHVTGRGMFKAIKKRFPDIQLLALDYDPDTSFANIENRLQMLIIYARELEKNGQQRTPQLEPVA